MCSEFKTVFAFLNTADDFDVMSPLTSNFFSRILNLKATQVKVLVIYMFVVLCLFEYNPV